MIATLGLYKGTLAFWLESTRPIVGYPKSAVQLFELMARHEIDVLHVHRDALTQMGLPEQLEAPGPGERRPPHPWLEGMFAGRRLSQRALSPSVETADHKHEIVIGAYQDGAGDPFAACKGAGELLRSQIAFSTAFPKRWDYKHSANSTGWKLMHSAYERGRRRQILRELEETPEQWAPGIEPAQVELPFGAWAAELTTYPFDRLSRTLAWDVNAQRLAACSRLSLGYGSITKHSAPEMSTAPGYHLVTRVDHPFEGLIPPIMEPGWHTTPRVQMALQLGIPIKIAESWVFEKSTPYLNPFYESMRDARAKLLDGEQWPTAIDEQARKIALGALKQCYLQPLGRLRSTRSRERGDYRYRPSWYDHVIGRELARQYLRLHQLAERKIPVLAVYFDTIIIESDVDQLQGPTAGDGALEISTQLGKYKPVGELPTASAIQALHGAGEPDVGRLVKALKSPAAVIVKSQTAPDHVPYVTGLPSSRIAHRPDCRHLHKATVQWSCPIGDPAVFAALQHVVRPCLVCKPYQVAK